jgi:hypothetical protein
MATGIQVVFDCADPDSLARFWAEAIGYKLQDPPAGYGSWEHWAREQGIPQERWNDASAVDPDNRGPRLYLQRVPEAKTTKNRVPLDFNAGGAHGTPLAERRRRIDAEVERLLGAGATRLGRLEGPGGMWSTWPTPRATSSTFSDLTGTLAGGWVPACQPCATSGGQARLGRTTTVTDMSPMTWPPNALAAGTHPANMPDKEEICRPCRPASHRPLCGLNTYSLGVPPCRDQGPPAYTGGCPWPRPRQGSP